MESKLSFFLLSFIVITYSQTIPCTYTDNNGNSYDLSPLTTESSYGFSGSNSSFWLNLCAPALGSPCSNITGGVAACQEWDPFNQNGNAVLATVNSCYFLTSAQGNLAMKCSNGQNGRRYNINFYCDTEDQEPYFIAEGVGLVYFFGWNTTYACQNASQKCNSARDCYQCTDYSQCSWCLTSSSCMDYQEASQNCSSFVSNEDFCPPECNYSTCEQCTESGEGCGWCLDSQSCVFRKSSGCKDLIGDSKFCGL